MKKVLIALCLTALLAGCESKPEFELKTLPYGVTEIPVNGKYKPVLNAKVSLIPLGPRQFKPGTAGEIALVLKNNGSKTVKIPEWRMNGPDNIRLYCQPWLPGTDAPDEDMWLPVDEEILQPEQRYTLELLPGNQAIVRKPLNFIEDLVVRTGAERRYFLKAELNLTSLNRKTEVFAIAVSDKQN